MDPCEPGTDPRMLGADPCMLGTDPRGPVRARRRPVTNAWMIGSSALPYAGSPRPDRSMITPATLKREPHRASRRKLGDMLTARTLSRYEGWLLALTGLPTAPGQEWHVVRWVRAWAKRRSRLRLRADRYGNLLLQRRGRARGRPLVFEAHMDQPAFVAEAAEAGRAGRAGRAGVARFFGGVAPGYFNEAPVRASDEAGREVTGRVKAPMDGAGTWDRRWRLEWNRRVALRPGTPIVWKLPAPRWRGDRLHAPACDNLAGVAAALAALDRAGPGADVRVLLTRAEEVGFLGTMAAARAGTLPAESRVIVLENSKASASAPIGAGPVARVGDRTATFDPDLTYRIGRVAEAMAGREAGFRYQRRLMPGGTCEASAWQALGWASACLCLPLGCYHNMNEKTGRIAPERIARSDFHGLVAWLGRLVRDLDDPALTPPLAERLAELYEARAGLLAARDEWPGGAG